MRLNELLKGLLMSLKGGIWTRRLKQWLYCMKKWRQSIGYLRNRHLLRIGRMMINGGRCKLNRLDFVDCGSCRKREPMRSIGISSNSPMEAIS
jgi:hypothetical protein